MPVTGQRSGAVGAAAPGPAAAGAECRRGRRRRSGDWPGLDDDVGELLRVDEPAQGVDRQLELLALGHRLLADLPGGHLDVLLGDGRDHVHGAEVQRRHLVGVEPDPQAVVALAEVGDAGDAGEPAQLVLDVDRRVVAQEQVVVAAVGRDQVHDHQRVGRHLLDVDAFVLHQRRESPAGPGRRGSAPAPGPCPSRCRA